MANQYKLVALARGISESGNAIRQLAMAIIILGVRNSAQDLFMAEALETMGYIVAFLLVSILGIGFNHIKAIIVIDLLAFANTLFLIYATLIKSLPLLWIGSFFMTFFSALHSNCVFTLATVLAGKTRPEIRFGLSYVQLFSYVGAFLSLIGGVFLLNKIPIFWCLIFDAITFCVSIGLIFTLLLHTRKNNSYILIKLELNHARNSIDIAGMISGIKLLYNNTSTRWVYLSHGFEAFAAGMWESIAVAQQKILLGFSESLLSLSRMINRSGAVIGSYILTKIGKSKIENSLLLSIFSLIFATGQLLIAIPLSLCNFLGNGISNIGQVTMITTLQSELAYNIKAEDRSKIHAIYSLWLWLCVLCGNFFVLFIFTEGRFHIPYILSGLGMLVVAKTWFSKYLLLSKKGRIPPP